MDKILKALNEYENIMYGSKKGFNGNNFKQPITHQQLKDKYAHIYPKTVRY